MFNAASWIFFTGVGSLQSPPIFFFFTLCLWQTLPLDLLRMSTISSVDIVIHIEENVGPKSWQFQTFFFNSSIAVLSCQALVYRFSKVSSDNQGKK